MKILFTIYKIEENKGSEDAPSFNVIKKFIEDNHHITILTRRNNIEKLKKNKIFKKAKLIELEVPKILSFYKKKNRGIILYYYIWQIFAANKIRKITRLENFDVIHIFNFHTDWCPHFIKSNKSKIVWGPIGHHKMVPFNYIRKNMIREVFKEIVKVISKYILQNFNPFIKIAIKNSDQILYANNHVAKPFIKCNKIMYIPYAGATSLFKIKPRINNRFNVLSVGRLENLKGFNLTIDSFILFYKKNFNKNNSISLTIIGEGSLNKELKKKIEANPDVPIKLINWIDQKKLRIYYKNSSVFLFPSLEAQGLVIAEAMHSSLPVICLKDTGPHFLTKDNSLAVKIDNYNKTVLGLSKKLYKVFSEYNNRAKKKYFLQRCNRSKKNAENYLNWNIFYNKLIKIYEKK